MTSPELNAKISVWRQAAIDGTLSQEDLREAIEALRGDRRSAAVASDKSRRAKAVAPLHALWRRMEREMKAGPPSDRGPGPAEVPGKGLPADVAMPLHPAVVVVKVTKAGGGRRP